MTTDERVRAARTEIGFVVEGMLPADLDFILIVTHRRGGETSVASSFPNSRCATSFMADLLETPIEAGSERTAVRS